MKTILSLIFAAFLLTSCSNPDTSGGVTLSRGGGGDWDNTFPYGSCKGPDYFDNQGSKTGCGWVHSDEGSHYITSCSNPETWDGVTLSRGCGNESTNVFPYGSCEGPSADAPSSWKTGCGWVSANGETHYIKPGADLSGALLDGANLSGANLYLANLENTKLRWANLTGAILTYAKLRSTDLNTANLSGADLRDAEVWRTYLGGANLTGAELRRADLNNVLADSRTICPNGIRWLTAGNNCPF